MDGVVWKKARAEVIGERPFESLAYVVGAIIFLSVFQSVVRAFLGIALALAIGAVIGWRNRGILSVWLAVTFVWYATTTPTPFWRFLSRLGDVAVANLAIAGFGALLGTVGYAVGRSIGTRRGRWPPFHETVGISHGEESLIDARSSLSRGVGRLVNSLRKNRRWLSVTVVGLGLASFTVRFPLVGVELNPLYGWPVLLLAGFFFGRLRHEPVSLWVGSTLFLFHLASPDLSLVRLFALWLVLPTTAVGTMITPGILCSIGYGLGRVPHALSNTRTALEKLFTGVSLPVVHRLWGAEMQSWRPERWMGPGAPRRVWQALVDHPGGKRGMVAVGAVFLVVSAPAIVPVYSAGTAVDDSYAIDDPASDSITYNVSTFNCPECRSAPLWVRLYGNGTVIYGETARDGGHQRARVPAHRARCLFGLAAVIDFRSYRTIPQLIEFDALWKQVALDTGLRRHEVAYTGDTAPGSLVQFEHELATLLASRVDGISRSGVDSGTVGIGPLSAPTPTTCS